LEDGKVTKKKGGILPSFLSFFVWNFFVVLTIRNSWIIWNPYRWKELSRQERN
jgi:hypothetical protein